VWKKRDPIARLARALEAASILPSNAVDSITRRLRDQIADAWDRALNDPYPDETSLLDWTWTPEPKK
jgi:TPP-dependent pyruvate/acetoin dehydrogenase alpha subunit